MLGWKLGKLGKEEEEEEEEEEGRKSSGYYAGSRSYIYLSIYLDQSPSPVIHMYLNTGR